MRKGIYIAILNQGSIRIELARIISQIIEKSDYRVKVTYPAEKPIAQNRNKIVQRFLNSDFDYLLMIDGDIIPPPNILDLADFQKDIIGGLCFMYQQDSVIPLALSRKKDGVYSIKQLNGNEGLVEVDAIGTGCMLISREVLEDILEEDKGPFMNEYDPDGIKWYGLDIAFCRRAKARGYKVYTHTDFPCGHWTKVDLKAVYKALLRASQRYV